MKKIYQLDQREFKVATQIHQVFQVSYQVEADLLNVEDFPPLKRSISAIQESKTQFFGYSIESAIAGIVEASFENKILDICSLVVAPDFFRRGIAKALMLYVLEHFDWKEAIVETGSKNIPAIKLYEGLGFVIERTWTPDHGIEKVALRKAR